MFGSFQKEMDYIFIKIKIFIAQIYMWIWSNTLYIKYYAYLIAYLIEPTIS